jgi:hypothetical protein
MPVTHWTGSGVKKIIYLDNIAIFFNNLWKKSKKKKDINFFILCFGLLNI